MRRPEGDDWFGIGLLVAGPIIAAACIALIGLGEPVGLVLLGLVLPFWLVVAYELWRELIR